MPRRRTRIGRGSEQILRLENRYLFATLFVDGTTGPDTIELSVSNGLVTAVLNGTPISMPDATATEVLIQGREGADTIFLRGNTDNPVTINSGTGNDTIYFSDGTSSLSELTSKVTLDAGTDSGDRIVVNDSSSPVSGRYEFVHSLSSLSLGWYSLPDHDLINVEHVEFTGSPFTDAIFATAPDQPLKTMTIDSGGGDDVVTVDVSVSSAVRGPVTVVGGIGEDRLEITDFTTSNSNTNAVQITSTAVTGGTVPYFSVSYATFEELEFRASPRQNAITIASTAAGCDLSVATRGDSTGFGDTVTVPNLSAIGGALALNSSGPPTNNVPGYVLTLNDSANTADETYSIAGNVISRPGKGDITLTDFRSTTLIGGAGDDTFDIDWYSFFGTETFALQTRAGDDAATVTLNDPFGQTPQLNIDFGTHSVGDALRVVDLDNPFADTWDVRNTSVGRTLDGVGFNSLEKLVLECSDGPNLIRVNTGASLSTTVLGGNGNDRLVAEANSTAVFFDGQQGIDDVVVETGAVVGTLGSQDLGVLTVNSTGRLNLGVGTTDPLTTATGVSVASTASLNVRDGTLLLDYASASPVSDVIANLTAGYAGGAWNGAGISSSTAASTPGTALGYAEATDLFTTFPATIAGVSVDDTTLIIRHTLYGDADLNRTVNIADFARLAANFNANPSRWSQANFNYDSLTDISDFSVLAGNFNASLPRTFSRMPIDSPRRNDARLLEDRVIEDFLA